MTPLTHFSLFSGIGGVTGTTFRQTLQCPKLSKKNMDGRTVSLAVDRPARTTTVLHE